MNYYNSTIMVFTESLNIHANHIGAIRINKEQLKNEFNVEINITRRRFGEYQEVDITGPTKDIRNCKNAFEIVVDQAEIDYQDYLERGRRRRRNEIKEPKKFKIPELIDCHKKRTNANPFAALDCLDEEDELEKSYEQSFPKLSTYDANISWGDMSDDE